MRSIYQIILVIGAVLAIIGSTYAFVESVRTDIRALDGRVDSIDRNLASVDTRLGNVENRLSVVESEVATIRTNVVVLDQRVETIEGRWATLLGPADSGADTMAAAEPETDVGTVSATEPDPVSITGEATAVAPDEVAQAIVVAEAGAYDDAAVDVAMAPAAEKDAAPLVFTIAEEKDSSFGNSRRRVTLEIETSGAEPASSLAIATMMRAARVRYHVDQPDTVSVRLWMSYPGDQNAANRIVYAPDGCGWSGEDCTGAVWSDLLKGSLPPDSD